MFCKWCGKRMEDYSVICPKCGKEQDSLVNGNGFWDLCHIEPNPQGIDIKKEIEDIKREDYQGKIVINAGENIKEGKKEIIADKVLITNQEEKKSTRKQIIMIAIFLIVLFGIGITVLTIVLNHSDISKQNNDKSESYVSSIEQSTTQTISNQINTTKSYDPTQESIIYSESVSNTNSQDYQDDLDSDNDGESITESYEEGKNSDSYRSWNGNGGIDDNDNNKKYDNDSDENPYY